MRFDARDEEPRRTEFDLQGQPCAAVKERRALKREKKQAAALHRAVAAGGTPSTPAADAPLQKVVREKKRQMAPYDGVLFDLFSALLDSQPAYDEVAGSAPLGSRWRSEHSRLSYSVGNYRPHDDLVSEAAERVGLSPDRAPALVVRLSELRPWPEAPAVLTQLRTGVKIGVVTNCSDEVGRRAAAQVGVPFDVVATAETAGAYKPRPEPYRLALEALDLDAARTLFVAGSPDDIGGADRVGMPVYWHNRRGLDLGDRARPLVEHDSLTPLLALAAVRSTV